MITHSVFFRLNHKDDVSFFAASKPLQTLPTVKNFKRLKQTSTKNNFAHGFSMQFSSQAEYDAYNTHPIHVAYVRDIWIPQVAEFMEIDFVEA